MVKNGKKMLKNLEKKMVNKVKNSQKRLTTVKTGKCGKNWLNKKNQNSQQW